MHNYYIPLELIFRFIYFISTNEKVLKMGNLTNHPHVYKVLTFIFLVLFFYNSTMLLYNYDNINIIEVSEKSYTHQNMETKLNQNKYVKGK